MRRAQSELPTKLGLDEVYVLGDNRESSGDSRVYGPVKAKDVSGRAFLIFWPFSKFGFAE
jgi:signal peptidase I